MQDITIKYFMDGKEITESEYNKLCLETPNIVIEPKKGEIMSTEKFKVTSDKIGSGTSNGLFVTNDFTGW